MNEAEARHWVRERFGVSRETTLAKFADHLLDASSSQNLVAPSTLDHIWVRHIVDSAQLIDHAPARGKWLDIGSGAGLPGLVIAALHADEVELVEPRRLRTAFLADAAEKLQLANATIVTSRVEQTNGPVDIISARAVASLGEIFRAALHRSTDSTIWVLPKGRNALSEVEAARHSWHGSFHVEPSITAPDSLVIVAQGVRPK